MSDAAISWAIVLTFGHATLVKFAIDAAFRRHFPIKGRMTSQIDRIEDHMQKIALNVQSIEYKLENSKKDY